MMKFKPQLAESKDHLEVVVREAQFKLEESESKLNEEKDWSHLAMQEERGKREEMELFLKQQNEEFCEKEKQWVNEKKGKFLLELFVTFKRLQQ